MLSQCSAAPADQGANRPHTAWLPMEHRPTPTRVRADLLPGRRVECLLEQTPGDWRWTPGAVNSLLLPQWPGWARVQFDSGDALEVELPLESEGDAWRWADAADSSSSDATVASQAKAPEMERVCSICTDAFAEMPPDTAAVELPTCRHAFCEECLGGWWSAAASSGSNSCPDCRRVYSGLRRFPRSTAGALVAEAAPCPQATPGACSSSLLTPDAAPASPRPSAGEQGGDMPGQTAGAVSGSKSSCTVGREV